MLEHHRLACLSAAVIIRTVSGALPSVGLTSDRHVGVEHRGMVGLPGAVDVSQRARLVLVRRRSRLTGRWSQVSEARLGGTRATISCAPAGRLLTAADAAQGCLTAGLRDEACGAAS